MLTLFENYGQLFFGAIGVVLLIVLSIMDVFNKLFEGCGE